MADSPPHHHQSPGGGREQQSSPSTPSSSGSNSRTRKKKKHSIIPPNATFVWARDGNHEGATEHPAYLLSSSPPPSTTAQSSPLRNGCRINNSSNSNVDNDDDDDDDESEECVWVQWASNGTMSRIPKSNISSDLPSRRSRRSISSSGNDNATTTSASSSCSVSPNNDNDNDNLTPSLRINNDGGRRRSRLSLTRKQRMDFKDHHDGTKRRRSDNQKSTSQQQQQQHDPIPIIQDEVIQHYCEEAYNNDSAIDNSNSPSSAVIVSTVQTTQSISSKVYKPTMPKKKKVSLSPSIRASLLHTTNYNDIATVHNPTNSSAAGQSSFNKDTTTKTIRQSLSSIVQKPHHGEIEIIDILDIDDDEEKKQEDDADDDCININTIRCSNGKTKEETNNTMMMQKVAIVGKGHEKESQQQKLLKQPPTAIDRMANHRSNNTPNNNPLRSEQQHESKLGMSIPDNPSSSSVVVAAKQSLHYSSTLPPEYTHRSSAYVQHLAEACTLLMTDARWHYYATTTTNCHTKSRGSCPQPTTTTTTPLPLFSWERGDDLSAVKAFVSLYDDTPTTPSGDENGTTTDTDTGTDGRKIESKQGQKEEEEQEDVLFERAMHLYSRMFHRKGPWFDLSDLYVRYYAPKKPAPEQQHDDVESMDVEDTSASSSEGVGSSGGGGGVDSIAAHDDDDDDKANTKTNGFFTPKSSQAKSIGSNSNSRASNNDIHSHQTTMEQLFQDLLRLLSMGLVRTFQSEYECGVIVGNVSMGRRRIQRRGTVLTAEERRDVLRRLGGGRGKSPKVAGRRRASAAARKSVDDGTAAASSLHSTNEILDQMQSQQSVLSSFAQPPNGGGEGGFKARAAAMLPVVKHVDKVLLRKLATKVASLVSEAPRTSVIEATTHMIHRAWTSAYACHNKHTSAPIIGLVNNGMATAFRLREPPLKTLRRCMRLFLCAGGGPGAMRGDGTNGWISVLGDGESGGIDPTCPSFSNWHNVSYPGLSSRFGLEFYGLSHCYTPVSLTSHNSIMPAQLEKGDVAANNSSTTAASRQHGVFSGYCEFQLWELGVELRSFLDQATEAYEMEKIALRRREKELAKLDDRESSVGCKVEKIESSADGKNATIIQLLTRDGFALLTEEGRKDLAKSIMIPCFNEAQLSKHTTLDLVMANVCRQIEVDILSLSNNATNNDDEDDGFISDTERMIAATAVICHIVLQLRIKHPSMMLISLVKRPWLRHTNFDAILTYMLWDCVPIFERRGHHLMAVSILQTILFGQDVCIFHGNGGELSDMIDHLRLGNLKVQPSVQCLLPRRNRGKALERLVIDIAHVDRRAKKASQQKPKKKKTRRKSSNDIDNAKEESQQQILCNALLTETSGSIPFCSLRNLARRSKAPLPQTNERSILNIRPTDNSDWSPKTDSTVANAISGDSSDSAVGKRCAFVGWEMHQGEAVEAQRSLNVEELAMEEYHHGRLPCDDTEEEVKGNWVGWHNEGGHVRALFRILCLPHLLEESQDKMCLDDQTTVVLTPYQSSPHDLHVGYGCLQSGSPIRGFYERRRLAIESFLSSLSQSDECSISTLVHEAVKKRWERHVDDRSRLKDPRLLKDVMELRTLQMIAASLGSTALACIFRTLCFDYRHWSGGLPDLFLVRARYESATDGNNSTVDLADWIGEGFSQVNIDEKNIQRHISMLADRDDEFLGQPKNADGGLSSQTQHSARKKQGAAKVELPSFPDGKLEFMHDKRRVKAECLFVEVKSSNDRLSERQEDWLSILENCTNARVCKFNSNNSK